MKLVECVLPAPLEPGGCLDKLGDCLLEQELHSVLAPVDWDFLLVVVVGKLGLLERLEVALSPGAVSGEHGRFFVVACHDRRLVSARSRGVGLNLPSG